MKKALVFLMSVLVLLTQNIAEIVAFLMLLLLLLYMSMLIASIRRYLTYRRFTKERDELFTEEFYTRLNTTIENEFK